MPKEFDWPVMRDTMRALAHDSMQPLGIVSSSLALLKEKYPNSKLDRLYKELHLAIDAIREVHINFGEFRRADEQPSELELKRTIVQYRKQLAEADKKLFSVFDGFKVFHDQHKQELRSKTEKEINNLFYGEREYKSQFSSKWLGKKMPVRLKQQNMHKFLDWFLKQKFVDRDGNAVKIEFWGKDVGEATFDGKLLYRSLHNLVTDSLSHTPGRPIYISLNREKGKIMIGVTNEGPNLKKHEIKKIGKVRFTRAMHDPKRGYGKISSRLITEAMGGKFKVDNSHFGPRLSMTFPVAKSKSPTPVRRRRAA